VRQSSSFSTLISIIIFGVGAVFAYVVDVDAALFWKVVDPKRAALDVADYQSAISWASQTALRDVIGKTMLSDMLEGRDKISSPLQKIIRSND